MANVIRAFFHRGSSQTNSNPVSSQATQVSTPPTAASVRQVQAPQRVLTSVPPVHARPTALPVVTVPTNPPVVPRPALTSVPPVHAHPTNLHVVTVPRNPSVAPRSATTVTQPRRIEMHTMSEQEVQKIQENMEIFFSAREEAGKLFCAILFPMTEIPITATNAIFEKYKLEGKVDVILNSTDRPDQEVSFLIKDIQVLISCLKNYPQVKVCNFTRCIFSNYDDLSQLRGIITGAVFSKHMKLEHYEKCKTALGPNMEVGRAAQA